MKSLPVALRVFKVVVSLLIFVAAAIPIFYVCYLLGHRVLEGGLAGGDTPYHLSLMHAIDKFYPSIPVWFPFAGAGSSLILGYWSFSYYVAIFASHLSNMTLEQWVRILEFAAVPLISTGIYVYIWVRLKNHLTALLGALLYPLSSMAWGWLSHAGFFAMQVSGSIYIPAFLFFDLYLEAELTNFQAVTRKRLYLLGFLLAMAVGILVHGSFLPNFYLGLPLYALLRSQLKPRTKEKRVMSLLRAIKVLVFLIPLGIVAGAFILIPQQKYFSLQPFTPTYGASDTPYLPWKGFLGFERLSGSIGSLYTPLFMSQLVSVFAVVGTVLALLKRKFIGALGLVAFFYVWVLSSAQYLAINLPFTQLFVLPVATRAATVTSAYLTIMAAYGMWSVAALLGESVRFLFSKIFREGKPSGLEGKLAKGVNVFVRVSTFFVSSVLLLVLAYKSFYFFRPRQVFPPDIGAWGAVEPYQGYGTMGFPIPFCKVPGWENEVGKSMTCDDYMPKNTVDHAEADFWVPSFTQDVEKLDLSSNTRVSVSPYLGWLTFSFTKHSVASMVSAPSGQSIINLEWLGIHDNTLFLEGEHSADEASEIAKWFGTKYVFTQLGLPLSVAARFPADRWTVALVSGGVEVKDFKNSTGVVSLSNKPSVLLIGSQEKRAYVPFFQGAIKGALSFDEAVVVEGKSELIDDYSADELRNFAVVVLRGYSYRDKNASWSKLTSFVENGGSVFVDTGWQYVDKDWGIGPDKEGQYMEILLPEPLPVKKTFWGNIGTSWLDAKLDNSVVGGVDLAKVGQPVWGTLPWGMAVGQIADLRSWAKPVLSKGNSVVIAAGQLGKGRVVWSGMNLFSHASDKASSEEYILIAKLFDYLLGGEKTTVGQLQMVRPYPDKAEFRLVTQTPGVSNIYWAETYTPYWKAYAYSGGNRKELKVYKSGPGFMSVFMPTTMTTTKVVFELDMRRVFILAIATTLSVFILVTLFIFDSLVFNSSIERSIRKLVGRHFSSIKTRGKKGLSSIVSEDEE